MPEQDRFLLAARSVTTPEPGFWTLVRADIEATTEARFRDSSRAFFWFRALVKLVVGANVRVVVMYRIGHILARRRFLLPFALILRARGIRISGAELNPFATIGPGLYLAHAVGIDIGAYVRIGSNCRVHLGAVVGMQPHGSEDVRFAVIGNDVFIGTHAVILAGVTVGDGATIGANAVVVRDVEPYTVVAGPPARAVWKRNADDARP